MGDFISVAEARSTPGLRLVVTKDVPNPWGEAAKSIFHVKRIAHARVAQIPTQANEELVAWTGQNSGPIAIWNDEPPRSGWVELLMLAERLAPEPRLIPRDERERALMFGMAHELCSEDGYGWNRRLLFFSALEPLIEVPDQGMDRESFERMQQKYRYGGDVAHCRARLIAILKLLSEQLRAQARQGSRYYIGDSMTALDIYAACFMAMVKPLPLELCPTTPEYHAGYHERDPDILAAADPMLLDHRDYIYDRYLELPMRL